MGTTAQVSTTINPITTVRRWGPFKPSTIFITIVFLVLSFIFLLPLYWMIISSFKPTEDIFSTGFNLIPARVTTDAYTRLLASPYPQWFLNSVLQSSAYAVFTVAICALGGFALAKYQFPFRNVIFFGILMVQVVPFYLLLVSLFVLIANLHLVDTYWGAM